MINPDNRIVTVFGGDGFIGRYVCELLFRKELRVRVACRDPRNAYFLQPLARVGSLGVVRCDVADTDRVRAVVEDSSAVINLAGTFTGSLHKTHVDGARNIGEAARDAGAASLVHISAIGCDPESDAVYGRTKAQGEAAIRDAFPSATIIRPSIVFGPEDNLTNRLAGLSRLPVLPVVAAKRQFQPVYVKDIANAIVMAALDPRKFGGKTYEIGGPQVMTMEDIYALSARAAGHEPDLLQLPDFASSILSWFGFLPGAPLTRDQWKMLQADNLPSKKSQGLEAFGIEPTALESVAVEWLGRFRQGGRWMAREARQAG